MKNLGLLLAYLAFLSLNAQAGLPPLTSKGSTDTSGKTTLNLQFPEHRITHTGVTASISPVKTATNFIGQSTSWAITNPDDRDLESSGGNWTAFANTVAGVQPDNGMTGGSPTITCARSTTTPPPLDGSASLLITKGASNIQGNGCSVVFNVQPAYQGSTATITASFNVSSGSIAQGDVKLFIYDVTNSILITPSNNDVLSGPNLTATFTTTGRAATPANQQYRLGIFFASTSATAATLQLDNFSISPGQATYGMAGSNWISYATTIDGLAGTSTAYFSRVGDSMEVRIRGTYNGTSGASIVLRLPSGYNADTSKMQGVDGLVGTALYDPVATAYKGAISLVNGTTNTFRVDGDTGTVGRWDSSANNRPVAWTNPSTADFSFRVPIAGWDAGVSISPSQTYDISSYLVSGTRVTSTPTALGQYRTLVKSAAAYTGTDSAPTTGWTPTVSDGMRIDAQYVQSSAGTSGQPGRWEMFVGKNKHVEFKFYASTGKTGQIDAAPEVYGTTIQDGIFRGYDPTTGVAWIDGMISLSGTVTTRAAGLSFSSTGFTSTVTGAYFDVTVSDNALSVGVDSPQVVSATHNAFSTGGGSTASTWYIPESTWGVTLTPGMWDIQMDGNADSAISGTYGVQIIAGLSDGTNHLAYSMCGMSLSGSSPSTQEVGCHVHLTYTANSTVTVKPELRFVGFTGSGSVTLNWRNNLDTQPMGSLVARRIK